MHSEKKMEVSLPAFRKPVPKKGMYDNVNHIDFMLISYSLSDTKLARVTQHQLETHSTVKNGEQYIDEDTGESPDKNITQAHLHLFGRTKEGYSIAFDVTIFPCLILDVPENWCQYNARQQMEQMRMKYRIPSEVYQYELKRCHPTAGFYPDMKSKVPKIGSRPFLFVYCKSMRYLYSIRHFFVENTPLTVVEKQIPVALQFLNECKITPSGIVRVKRSALSEFTSKFSSCDLEYSALLRPMQNDTSKPFAPSPIDEIFPMVILSFDIGNIHTYIC